MCRTLNSEPAKSLFDDFICTGQHQGSHSYSLELAVLRGSREDTGGLQSSTGAVPMILLLPAQRLNKDLLSVEEVPGLWA